MYMFGKKGVRFNLVDDDWMNDWFSPILQSKMYVPFIAYVRTKGSRSILIDDDGMNGWFFLLLPESHLMKRLTVTVDKVGKIKVKLAHCHADVVGVDAEGRMKTVGGLFQSFAVRRFQRNGFEQDHHHQVQTPHFVRLRGDSICRGCIICAS